MTECEVPMVQANHLIKDYGSLRVLNDVNLHVKEGEVVFIMGPSGAGKSTLIRCLNHIEDIGGGSVYIDGELLGYQLTKDGVRRLSSRRVAQQRARIGMVFQQFNLFPHMSVLQNVIEAPMGVLGESRANAMNLANDLLEQVGLPDKTHAYPKQLSGGQQQRVAIARALAMRPKVILFDEPTSALDPELVGEVLEVMGDLARKGMTMVVVSHEVQFARSAADRIVVMDGGKIIEDGGAQQVLDEPRHPRTKTFLGRFMASEQAIE